MNETVLFYVEQTVTLHTVCFTCEPKCFYWLVVRLHFSFFVLVNEQNKERTKTFVKENGEFYSQTYFINFSGFDERFDLLCPLPLEVRYLCGKSNWYLLKNNYGID